MKETWIEMKFDDVMPSCRTMHAQIVHQERMFIYGGTDLKYLNASAEEVWYLDPLRMRSPEWKKIDVSD